LTLENQELPISHSESNENKISVENASFQPKKLELQFVGSAKEYFRIWIVNLCLSLVSLGIFSAWAKVRKKRFFYSHTLLDGTPFQYLGQPIPILKGRILATLAFVIYYVSSHFYTASLLFVYIIGTVIAPWIIVASVGFNARYSAFRNMTFQFNGKYQDAYIVISLWIGVVLLTLNWWIRYWWGMALILILFFAIPRWIKEIKCFFIDNISFGNNNGKLSATSWQFYKIYLVAGLILIAGVILVYELIFWGILPFPQLKSPVNYFRLSPISLIPIYFGYFLAYAYVQAHSSNILWNQTRLGPIRFQSTLAGTGMANLYFTNTVAIAMSLGLLIPWAVIRTLKYRIKNLQIHQEDYFTSFQGNERKAINAMGSEISDFFNLDMSL